MEVGYIYCTSKSHSVVPGCKTWGLIPRQTHGQGRSRSSIWCYPLYRQRNLSILFLFLSIFPRFFETCCGAGGIVTSKWCWAIKTVWSTSPQYRRSPLQGSLNHLSTYGSHWVPEGRGECEFRHDGRIRNFFHSSPRVRISILLIFDVRFSLRQGFLYCNGFSRSTCYYRHSFHCSELVPPYNGPFHKWPPFRVRS